MYLKNVSNLLKFINHKIYITIELLPSRQIFDFHLHYLTCISAIKYRKFKGTVLSPKLLNIT